MWELEDAPVALRWLWSGTGLTIVAATLLFGTARGRRLARGAAVAAVSTVMVIAEQAKHASGKWQEGWTDIVQEARARDGACPATNGGTAGTES